MNRGTVLVVDDNEDAADLLVVMLTISGWEAHAVYSGAAAIESVGNFRPNIILLDIGMPDMSGLTVAEKLRASLGEQCPALVAVTAWSDPATKTACYSAGMLLHLTKPVSIEVLDGALSSLIQS